MKQSQQKVMREFVRILFRHKRKALAFFLLVSGATLAAIVFWPRTYRSEAKLFVRVGRESVALDPTATTGQTVDLTDSRETEINSVLEILRSRGLAEKVVDRLGPGKVLGKEKGGTDLASNGVGDSLESNSGLFSAIDPVNDYERAVTKLQRDMFASSQKRSTVIDVGCTADSPKTAREIVATLLDVFKQEHARLNHTAGSLDFFSEQTTRLEKQLAQANNDLRNAKDASQLASIDGQRTMLQQEMSTVEAELNNTENILASSRARAQSLTDSMARMPERLHTDQIQGMAHAASDAMRKTLYDLELKAFEARSRYTDEHPTISALAKQVADARTVVERHDTSRTQSTETVNPARIPLLTALPGVQSEVAAAAAKLDTLAKQRGEVLAKLKLLNDHELKIVQVQRQVDHLNLAFRSYVEKREQSRIDAALAQDRISNVNVVQAPTLVAKPIRPNKPATLIIGLALAVCGAVGLAFMAQSFDQSLKSAGDVEQSLDVSVLVTIPRTSRHRVMMN